MKELPDSRIVLSCSEPFILIWSSEKEGKNSLEAIDVDTSIISCIELSDDTIFAGCEDGNIKHYNSTGQELIRELGSHSGKVTVMEVIGGILVTTGEDKRVCIWNSESGEKLTQFNTDHVINSFTADAAKCLLIGTSESGHI